jgi:hypothetical protein
MERYYMSINDVKEWMIIADADFESAKILGLFDNSVSYLTSLAKCKAFCCF